MDRVEFELLLRTPGKRFRGAPHLKASQAQPRVLRCKAIIDSAEGKSAIAHITYNVDTTSKTIAVSISGVGPICRLDVDGSIHGDVGRSHKHDLQTAMCSSKNLPHAVARAELAGFTIEQVLQTFCSDAKIEYPGLIQP